MKKEYNLLERVVMIASLSFMIPVYMLFFTIAEILVFIVRVVTFAVEGRREKGKRL